MPKDKLVHLLKIELIVYTFGHFTNAAGIFDAWKQTQDHSHWNSSGWAITSPNSGILFISSSTAINPETIVYLKDKLSHVCLKVIPTQKEITAKPH